jgi:hypothetical protein
MSDFVVRIGTAILMINRPVRSERLYFIWNGGGVDTRHQIFKK